MRRGQARKTFFVADAPLDRAGSPVPSGAVGRGAEGWPKSDFFQSMTFSTELRHRLEYAGFRLAEGMTRALPVEVASRTSGLAWRLVAPHLYRQERVMRNLALAYPEMTEAERKKLAAKMWENLGRTFAESFHLDRIASEGRVTFESEERWTRSPAAARAWCAACTSATGNSSPAPASAWALSSPASISA